MIRRGLLGRLSGHGPRTLSGTRPQQRGQTMTEYLIILPSLLMLVLSVIQFALIYQAKASLNYATFMGARQGALKNANKTSIKDGLAGGMTPFFTRASGAPFLDDLAKGRIIAAIEVFNPMTTNVVIISPTVEAYNKLKASDASIPNDNLAYRSSAVPDGAGMSIQDANLLKIRVTYCVKLVVPFVDRIIYGLASGIAAVQNGTNTSFWGSNVETLPNFCSPINGKLASVRQQIKKINDALPPGISLPTSGLDGAALSGATDLFPNIPGLNWNIGGMRIPITSEAIVRMQSPIQF